MHLDADQPAWLRKLADRSTQLQFLTLLGQALSAADDPVSSTERTLEGIASTFGITNVEIAVLPTMLIVRAREAELSTVELAGGSGRTLRLDQIGEVYAIADCARRGVLDSRQGIERLAAMWNTPPRFGLLARLAGHSLLTVGLGLILIPQPTELLWCAGLGLLVGLLRELGAQWAGFEVLMPVAASLLASLIVFAGAAAGLVAAPLLLLISPLITFLPGGTLTTAMVELADHHPISGSTRLVAGATQVILLVFGIVLGQTLVGLNQAEAFAPPIDELLRWWLPWLGPLVFAIGMFVHGVGPRGSLPWILLVVYVAWIGEQLGIRVFGGYLGGFLGAVLMTMAAYTAEGIAGAPPSRVLFLPGFWLLVPGALAVLAVTELVGSDLSVAVADVGTAVFTVVAIALGVLVGIPAARVIRARM
jgi:uncharacterized membrane protein YjjP (DUF1212 family)